MPQAWALNVACCTELYSLLCAWASESALVAPILMAARMAEKGLLVRQLTVAASNQVDSSGRTAALWTHQGCLCWRLCFLSHRAYPYQAYCQEGRPRTSLYHCNTAKGHNLFIGVLGRVCASSTCMQSQHRLIPEMTSIVNNESQFGPKSRRKFAYGHRTQRTY